MIIRTTKYLSQPIHSTAKRGRISRVFGRRVRVRWYHDALMGTVALGASMAFWYLVLFIGTR